MLAWIRTPRGSTMTATVAAVLLALFWLEPWQKPLPRLPFSMPFAGGGDTVPAALPTPGQQAGLPSSQAAMQPVAPPSSAPPAVFGSQGAASGQQAALPAPVGSPAGNQPASHAAGTVQPTGALPNPPGFDIVRVEPTGDAVIAGRAEPGSDVALLDGDKVIGHVQADAEGEFTLLPDALSEGSHYLTLQTRRPGGTLAKSVQGVAVSVARNGGAKPLVALLAPDKPAQVLSDGSLLPGGAGKTEVSAGVPVSIQAVEAGQGGQFTAAGVAHPGNQCRVYLNGAYLADVTAGKDGRWSVEIKKGMKPGRYSVRADELEPGSGKVMHRAEVPFDYPATLAGGVSAKSLLARKDGTVAGALGTGQDKIAQTDGGLAGAQHVASAASGSTAPLPPGAPASDVSPDAAAVISDLHSTTVLSGDSLWRISRKMLGHGIKYTEIYASNVKQIKNPALIYPGQIFVVPSSKPN